MAYQLNLPPYFGCPRFGLFTMLSNFITKSSIIQSGTMSVCLKLKISVTTEPIGLYSSGKIPTGPVMVLSYYRGGGTPPPQKNTPPKKFFF